ncbi:MAG: 3-dehydroquinate synthase [Alcanivoracaceae bacterium]|jgi:3-dehydroquinate synthase|nr:3-dehydroquinate synthase [Alcanivoracaceae bacterium]
MLTLNVALSERSYPIYIGKGLIDGDLLRRHVRARQVLVVTNTTIAPLYLDRVIAALSGLQVDTLQLPDGEKFKTLSVLEQVFDKLLEARHARTTTLIALGGGVVGDMVGFAAACYQRGVDFIQVPTTLLAQVDSSVGGKTAVNHPRGKNMIGAFHQPKAVIIDTDVLSTLPAREFSAGLAEVIKYGLIRDREFYRWITVNIDALLARDPALLSEAILRSCQNKADIVAEDETEQGSRALLNLGHTFGHAIETATGYTSWLHGEAVAAGMVMAAQLSVELGWLAQDEVDGLAGILARAKLPVRPPQGMSARQCRELMALDKKVHDGSLRLVLLRAIGDGVVTADYDEAVLMRMLERDCVAGD